MGRPQQWRRSAAEASVAEAEAEAALEVEDKPGRRTAALAKQQPIPYTENNHVKGNAKSHGEHPPPLDHVGCLRAGHADRRLQHFEARRAAAETGPRTFATPDDAGAALLTAVKAGDHNGAARHLRSRLGRPHLLRR